MDAPRKLTPSPPWAFFNATTPTTLGWRNGGVADQYELQIRRNSYWPGSTPINWVDASGNLSVTQVTPTNTAIDQTVTINSGQLPVVSADGYKWRVRSREAATATWSAWSAYSRLAPTIGTSSVTITEPTSVVGSNHTRVVFTYRTDYEPLYTMSFRVRQYLSGVTVFDSGEVSAQIPSGSSYAYIVKDYTNLNLTNYTVGVSVRSGYGLWEDEATKSFLSTPTGLAAPSFTVNDRGDGRVSVDSNAIYVGKDVLYQSLYRYNPVMGTDTLLITVDGTYLSYTDTAFPLNSAYYYTIEVTAADGTIQSFDSDWLTSVDDGWYLVNGGVRQEIVVTEFSSEHAARPEYLEPLGRSRSVSFKLETEGREGTIAFHVLESERTALLAFVYGALASDNDSYIVSPHGDVLRIKVLSPDIQDGVGGDCTVALKFVEVAQS